jgi:hypothetical protein
MALRTNTEVDHRFLTREDVSHRDRCAYLLEFMTEKELAQIAEFALDHIEDGAIKKSVADYATL